METNNSWKTVKEHEDSLSKSDKIIEGNKLYRLRRIKNMLVIFGVIVTFIAILSFSKKSSFTDSFLGEMFRDVGTVADLFGTEPKEESTGSNGEVLDLFGDTQDGAETDQENSRNELFEDDTDELFGEDKNELFEDDTDQLFGEDKNELFEDDTDQLFGEDKNEQLEDDTDQLFGEETNDKVSEKKEGLDGIEDKNGEEEETPEIVTDQDYQNNKEEDGILSNTEKKQVDDTKEAKEGIILDNNMGNNGAKNIEDKVSANLSEEIVQDDIELPEEFDLSEYKNELKKEDDTKDIDDNKGSLKEHIEDIVLPDNLDTEDGIVLPDNLDTEDGIVLPDNLDTEDGIVLPDNLDTEADILLNTDDTKHAMLSEFAFNPRAIANQPQVNLAPKAPNNEMTDSGPEIYLLLVSTIVISLFLWNRISCTKN